MYYPCSENEGADQLRSYFEADLRLCFRLCRSLSFTPGGSILLFLNRNPTIILHDLHTNIYLKEITTYQRIIEEDFRAQSKNGYKLRMELFKLKTFIPERGVKKVVIVTVSLSLVAYTTL